MSREWAEVPVQGEPPTPRTFHKAVIQDGYMSALWGTQDNATACRVRIHIYGSQTKQDEEGSDRVAIALMISTRYIMGGFDGYRQNDTHRFPLVPRSLHLLIFARRTRPSDPISHGLSEDVCFLAPELPLLASLPVEF